MDIEKSGDFEGFDEEIRKRTLGGDVEKVYLSKEENENIRIGEGQFYDIITSRKPDWQAIIYDLIHTEQLDPWDIDIVRLTEKYFEKIRDLDETDFYDSSKVLLAAALLLRIKSEFLLNKYLRSIDEILFGRKESEKKIFERIEINDDDIPMLIPRTPLPRSRRVTLAELMTALNKAITTESRRIKREVAVKRAQKLSEVDFPQFRRIDLKDRIKHFYAKVLTMVRKKSVGPDKHMNKVGYSDLAGREKEEKLACFLPVLHLSNTKKLWLEQEGHLEEIWIFLHEYFDKNRDKFVEELEEDIEAMKEELERGENLDEEEELVQTLKKEIKILKQEKEIEKVTGFGDELE